MSVAFRLSQQCLETRGPREPPRTEAPAPAHHLMMLLETADKVSAAKTYSML